MKKLKAFAYILKKSLTSLEYYKDVIKTELGFSIKYLASLAFILAIIVTVKISIFSTPKIQSALKTGMEDAREIFPKDLIITAESGQITINQPEPYAIPFPEEYTANLEETATEAFPKNIVVFDSDGTLNDMATYETLALVNNTNLLLQNTTKTEVYPLNDMPDGQLTYDRVSQNVNDVIDLLKYTPLIIFVAVLVGLMIYYVGIRAFYLVFVALILMVIGLLQKQKHPFQDYYQVALHTMTLPLLLEVVLILVGVSVNVSWLFGLINLVFGFLVLNKLRSTKPVGTTPTAPENNASQG
jgi:hypothetical protein